MKLSLISMAALFAAGAAAAQAPAGAPASATAPVQGAAANAPIVVAGTVADEASKAALLARLRADGLADVPVVVGGIIPPQDAAALRAEGVARVFTPKDYQLPKVMAEIVGLLEAGQEVAQPA